MSGVYNIPYSCSFVDTLAQKFSQEYENKKEELADVIFLLPNRRTCLSLKEAFVRYNGKKPTMLPKIVPIGDFQEEDIFLLNGDNSQVIDSLKPAIDEFERLFIFARLIDNILFIGIIIQHFHQCFRFSSSSFNNQNLVEFLQIVIGVIFIVLLNHVLFLSGNFEFDFM